MRRIALRLQYDGTDFAGFQRQPGLRTVQGELESGLTQLCGHRVQITAAGRTDAGVHASGQVVHFDTPSAIPDDRVAGALNILSREVRVDEARTVGPRFHARYSAASRSYLYLLLTHRDPSPFEARYLHHARLVEAELGVIEAAIGELVGRRDVAPFSIGRTGSELHREIYQARLVRCGAFIALQLCANGFVRGMIRTIVGALLYTAGHGPEGLRRWRALLSGSRDALRGDPAPARGLYLTDVEYPPGLVSWVERGAEAFPLTYFPEPWASSGEK